MEGGNSTPKGRIISCLKAYKMITKGCLYHIKRVKDLEFGIPPIESVPIEKVFPEVFSNNLPKNPPEQEINFGIKLLLDTNPISIPHYRIALTELKE